MQWRVGTMGFSYADWRGVFYPPDLATSKWLAFYARQFDCIELDTTFHATPSAERFARWASAVPDDFAFCVKTPRALTHDGAVSDSESIMKSFLTPARHLGHKLAIVLIQYPPAFHARLWPQVRRFLDTLPSDLRFAVEFRNRSWFDDASIALELSQRRIALVSAEYDTPPRAAQATTDFAYLRLIGLHERFDPLNVERFDPTPALVSWKTQIESLGVTRAWVMLNNDYAGYSVASAQRFKRLVGQSVQAPHEAAGMLF